MNESTKPPTVAVVIPVYCGSEQHEDYLRETLKSVAAQTFRDFHAVIIDDVSPRDIRPIIDSIPGLPSVTIIRNESNLGHARSRNRGVESTSSELIAFLDHDDLWMPDKLARQVEILRENPEAAMLFCRVEIFGPRADRLRIDQSSVPERPSFLWLFYHGNYVITASAALVRRDALLEIGLFDPRYTTSDDYDAWLKIVQRRPIIYMPDVLARYRLHSRNVNYGVDRSNDSNLLFAVYADYWRRAPLVVKLALLPRLARKLIGRLYYYMYRHRRFKD